MYGYVNINEIYNDSVLIISFKSSDRFEMLEIHPLINENFKVTLCDIMSVSVDLLCCKYSKKYTFVERQYEIRFL